MRVSCVLFSLCLSAAAFAESLSITNFVGSDGGGGYRDGVGSAARFDSLWGIATDASGNIYAADFEAKTIRRITPSGVVTTLAGLAAVSGSTNGQGGSARFLQPYALATDAAGNAYVADSGLLRKISPTGAVTTLTSGLPSTSFGIAVDTSGNIFMTDLFGALIIKITPAGIASAFVGTAASPRGLTIDSSNNLYYTTDAGTIYKCTPLGVITTVGTVPYPYEIEVDASGILYISASDRIMKMTSDGTVTEFAGSIYQGHADGYGGAASFVFPRGLAFSPDGSALYVADEGNHTIRRIAMSPSIIVSTLAGKPNDRGLVNDTGLAARFSGPSGAVLAPDGNLYVADGFNWTIRKVTPAGVVSTLAGGTRGNIDGVGTTARFNVPIGITYGYDGGVWVLYVTDVENDNVRKVAQDGTVTTIATGVDGADGITVDAAGDLYVAEFHGNTIKKIDMPSATVTVFAGASGTPGFANGTGTAARFQNPSGIAADGSGNLFVADEGNRRIRQIVLATAAVTTYAGSNSMGSADGTGAAATFSSPDDILSLGNDLYVTDNNTIRRIEPGAVVTTVAGKFATWVSRDGTGDIARFANVGGLAGDSTTNLFVCDQSGNNIRKARIPGISDVATVSTDTPYTNSTVQLNTAPATATTWTWSLDRRPTGSTAELSSTTIRNPTFVPDVADTYVFLLRAEGPDGIRYSTVTLTASACPDPLTSVVASTATTNVCGGADNGMASVSVSGGMTLAYQWGYRTTSGGAITPISGATSSTYSINGYDFGGSGDRLLVVTVTPSCGTSMVSNELPLNVKAPFATISAGSAVYANATQNFASVPDSGAGATYTWGITNGTITAGQGTRLITYTAGASGTVALTLSVSLSGCSANGNANVPIQARPSGATMLYIVTPCRIADTRYTTAIANNETRNITVAGLCGIPADATAVVANIIAVSPVTTGWLSLWPAGTPWTNTSTLNYRTGKTRANNAVIPLSVNGMVSVLNNGGTQHVILDVTGYFR